MKNLIYILTALIFAPFLIIQAQNGNTYVGVETCAMCHKTEKQGSQLSIWKNSAHSKAFETLKDRKSKSNSHRKRI